MEIHINIAKIVTEALEKYPTCAPLQRKFEKALQLHLVGLKRKVEDAEQIGALLEVKAEYKRFYEIVRKEYRQDWSKVNVFVPTYENEYEADSFIDFRFFESAVKWFNENVSERGVPSEPEDLRPLAPYFHGSDKLDLALKAATETGLLTDGKWKHMGEKTNAVSIFWRAAVTALLAKADAPLYKVAPAMKEQFGMDNLGVNAIDKKKEISDFGEQYKELYKSLLAIMRP